jgi:beta-lactamase superfamily II metal-dependent hydrolase
VKIEVHDVDHGACIVCTSSAGHRLMIDCGRSRSRPWSPSTAYRGQRIDTLLASNLDEDHVEDFEGLWSASPIGAFVSNPTIGSTALGQMKNWDMRSGVNHAWSVLHTLGPQPGNWSHPLGGMHWHSFWNRYGTDFIDTNNLSLATFVDFGRFRMLYGGDLETPGWRKLLAIPDFRAKLSSVALVIASHHGRENGQCDELYELCKPQLIIFSDGEKQHETQETIGYYGSKATGIPDWSRVPILGVQPRRRVMTTRTDGTIQIDVGLRATGTSRPLRTRASRRCWPRSKVLGPSASRRSAFLRISASRQIMSLQKVVPRRATADPPSGIHG